MALAPFFERIYGAVGGHLSVSRDSLASALNAVVVGIECSSSPTPNERCIAELATNLIARLYPRISISGEPSFEAYLRQLASRINPLIEFVGGAPEHTICIGDLPAKPSIYPSASGWVAYLNHDRPRASGAYNPYSASASAALASAELFRRIFLKSEPETDYSLSLLDFSTDLGWDIELNEHDLEEVVFVGLGAVGNAAVWALSHDPTVHGKLVLVDHEALTLSNLQRYVLGTYKDVSKPKVKLARRCLRNTALDVEGSRTRLEEFARQRKAKIKTLCISVDNVPARRAAQALLPRLAVNGWTGNLSLGSSWHSFSRDAACLACLYQPHGQGASAIEQAANALGLTIARVGELWVGNLPLSDSDIETIAAALGVEKQVLGPWKSRLLGELYTDVICGAVPLDIRGIGRIETVPLAHQSVLAGVLMAAEVVKRTNCKLSTLAQTETLVSWDDILKSPPRCWKKPRPREPGCICGDEDYQAVYRGKWG